MSNPVIRITEAECEIAPDGTAQTYLCTTKSRNIALRMNSTRWDHVPPREGDGFIYTRPVSIARWGRVILAFRKRGATAENLTKQMTAYLPPWLNSANGHALVSAIAHGVADHMGLD